MKPSASEEHQFLRQCFSGDQKALENFVRRFSPVIYHSIKNILLSKKISFSIQDLEDLHNTVFLMLFEKNCEKLKQYKGLNGCSLGSWIRVVTVRIVLNHLRKAGFESIGSRKKQVCLDEWIEANQNDAETLKLLKTADHEGAFHEAIKSLPARDQLFMNLHYNKGHSIKEVANALGLSMENAYTLKHRIIQRIKSSVFR